MLNIKQYEFWFCTGSQDLYGSECLAHVAEHSKFMVEKLNQTGNLPFKIVWKPVLITNELIKKRAKLYKFLYPTCKMISGDIADKTIYKEIDS